MFGNVSLNHFFKKYTSERPENIVNKRNIKLQKNRKIGKNICCIFEISGLLKSAQGDSRAPLKNN